MAAAITTRVADGVSNIVATQTVVAVQVTGADLNDATAYNANAVPPALTEPEIRYYILADAPAGVDDLRSQVFAPSHDGKFEWDNVVFPAAGSWTLRLRKASNDSDAATHAVTVTAP